MILQATAAHIPMKDKSVQLCAFSPPYWGLRKYQVSPLVWGNGGCRHEWGDESFKKSSQDTASGLIDYRSPTGAKQNNPRKGNEYNASQGQFCRLCGAWRGDLGLEPTPELFLDHMMLVMGEVWRVLRDDGVCFVNIGDSYSGSMKGSAPNHPGYGGPKQKTNKGSIGLPPAKINIKPKSLCLIPQKFAIRCQEAGWIIRSEIIWAKPNPMPESVKDRPTRSHEQVWMMTKQGKYYWDQEAVKVIGSSGPSDIKKMIQKKERIGGLTKEATDPRMKASKLTNIGQKRSVGSPEGRNIRSVWFIATQPTPEAHFATWPSKLVERMIRAATKPGDIVLDQFCGTSKTVLKAEELNRVGIGLDLSWEYLSEIAQSRVARPLQRELCVISL